MSKWLTHELAQEIVDKMMQDIPYSINIMNENGMIIGSGNKKRVGTIHNGAVRALETGEMVEIYQNNHYEKKGTNEPIFINNQTIGVVGITGDPKEVRPFCKLVKTTVSLLIEQSILIGNREAARKREAAFLDALLNEKKDYSEELIKEATHYQINLHLETSVIVIKNLTKLKEICAILKNFPFFKMENEPIYLFMLQNKNDKLIEELLNTDLQMVVTVGIFSQNVAESYRQALLCLKIFEKLHLSGHYFTYEKFQFLAELSNVNLPLADKHRNKAANLSELLLQTLKTYIYYNSNPTSTAQALMIHRNTLYYRLERIKQLTGKDPNHIMDLFELIYLLLQEQ